MRTWASAGFIQERVRNNLSDLGNWHSPLKHPPPLPTLTPLHPRPPQSHGGTRRGRPVPRLLRVMRSWFVYSSPESKGRSVGQEHVLQSVDVWAHKGRSHEPRASGLRSGEGEHHSLPPAPPPPPGMAQGTSPPGYSAHLGALAPKHRTGRALAERRRRRVPGARPRGTCSGCQCPHQL